MYVCVCMFVYMYVYIYFYALFANTLYPYYVIPPVQSTPRPQHNIKPPTTVVGQFKVSFDIVTASTLYSLSFCRWQHISLNTGVTMDKTARCQTQSTTAHTTSDSPY
jgi:hypothetical protein